MVLTKKLLLSLLIAVSLGAISTPSFAAKIKNATKADVETAIEDTIKGAEEVLAALNSGADKEAILALLKSTKQRSKRIEVSRLGRLQGIAAASMRKVRSAVKKDDMGRAKENAAKGIEHYKQIRKDYYAF